MAHKHLALPGLDTFNTEEWYVGEHSRLLHSFGSKNRRGSNLRLIKTVEVQVEKESTLDTNLKYYLCCMLQLQHISTRIAS